MPKFKEYNQGQMMLLPPDIRDMIKKSEENTKKQVKIIKADCGYWSKDNIEKLENTEIDTYIPDRRKSFEEKGMSDGTLNKYHWIKIDNNRGQFDNLMRSGTDV